MPTGRKKNGAEVVWIHHKLLEEACYINVDMNGVSTKMEAEDWMKYFIYEKK